MENYAKIVSFEEFDQLRDQLGRIVCTSGGFDPIHPGHASCLIESKQYGDNLVVVVNGDSFLRRKKGKPFMDVDTRCNVVSCIRGVDYIIPFDIEDDQTVCEALRRIRPHVFTKGGDRVDYTNIPEWQVCIDLGIELVPQVGRPKHWSSSDFLKEWGSFLEELRISTAALQSGSGDGKALPVSISSPEPGLRRKRRMAANLWQNYAIYVQD